GSGGGPCRHGTQYIVEGVSELDRGRRRECKPRRYMNDGLLPLRGRIVDSFREKTRRSYGDYDCTPIERGARAIIPINLQDAGLVLNSGFVVCVCHRSLLGRRHGAGDYAPCRAPNRRAGTPSGSSLASSRSSFWPHKEYLVAASVSL